RPALRRPARAAAARRGHVPGPRHRRDMGVRLAARPEPEPARRLARSRTRRRDDDRDVGGHEAAEDLSRLTRSPTPAARTAPATGARSPPPPPAASSG